VLTGYAYESVPDKPIITGKTTGPEVVTEPRRGASDISPWAPRAIERHASAKLFAAKG
jgi:hypothetical protein